MTGRRLNLTGQVFGRLVALEPGPPTPQGRSTWVCQCTCGNQKLARASNLQRGEVRSCGCLLREPNPVGGAPSLADRGGRRKRTRPYRLPCPGCGQKPISCPYRLCYACWERTPEGRAYHCLLDAIRYGRSPRHSARQGCDACVQHSNRLKGCSLGIPDPIGDLCPAFIPTIPPSDEAPPPRPPRYRYASHGDPIRMRKRGPSRQPGSVDR